MFAHLPRRETDPQGTRPQAAARKAGARLRWLAMLAAVTSGLLASAATIPAAFARVVPEPGGNYGPISPAPVPTGTVRVVTGGGMPGWQIIVIALGAVLLAAAVAVVLDRALAPRRAASSRAA